MRLKIWNLYLVVACIIVLGTQDVNSMVDNICTSTGDGISSLKNIRHDGISLNIRYFDPTGYIIFKVDAGNDQITNIVLWGEVMIAQSELHVGTLAAVIDHAYVHGCDGFPNSTITNYFKFENRSQITYKWTAPNKTTISRKDTQNQSKRGLSQKQSHKCSTPNHRHHHHHGEECKECSLKHHKHCISDHDHKKHNHHNHKKHNHHNHKKHNHHNHKNHNHHNHKNHNHHGHKNRHKPSEPHDNSRKKASKQLTDDKNRQEVTQSESSTNTSSPFSVESNEGTNPSNYSSGGLPSTPSGSLPSTPFYFKGVAMLASNPNQVIVFSSDVMYINGNIPVDYDSSDFDTSNANNDNNPVSSSAASFNNFKIFDINLALLVLLMGFSSIIMF